MEITKAQILRAMSEVMDPDFGKDLVSLNMVGDISINGRHIHIEIILTTPACPLKAQIESDINTKLTEHLGTVTVDLKFESKVTSMRTQMDLLPGVKNIIAISSGKGGVGKSTVSTNLAIALANTGAKVGLLDADIYGPSIPLMFGLAGERPSMIELDGKDLIVPLEKYGVKVLSIGFLIDPNQPVVWRGAMVTSTLKQFITDVDWGELDYLVLDLPPGTGDIHLTLVQTIPITGAIVVTTPQPVAIADVIKSIAMFRLEQIKVPIIGIIENMSYFTPSELPDKKYYVFGKEGGKNLADNLEIPFLGEIPIEQVIREGGDEGSPAVIQESSNSKNAFIRLANEVARQVSIRNEKIAATQIVEMKN